MNALRDMWISPNHFLARANPRCLMGADDVLVETIMTAAVNEVRAPTVF